MAEYDLFELANLSFDPPEKAAKKVKDAIEKAKKDLGAALGSATQQMDRDEINEKLAFLRDKEDKIFSDGKLNEAYEELAKKRVENEIEKLKAAVNLLKLSGKRAVTNGTIKTQRQKTKLSKENVEAVYTGAGFTITVIDPLAAMPKFPTNAEEIYEELAALRKSKDPNPNGADLTLAVDMYAFVAYLQGEPENAIEYRSKTSSELAKILEGYTKQFSTRNDNLGKLLGSLATKGKTYIFNTDDNRRLYELHLKYKGPALSELFATLKLSTKSDLQDAKFADVCIRKIMDVFGNGDIALAIYNNEAGLKDDPYIPEKAVFPVKCAHCQNISEFEDVQDAQKINKCSKCGKALYQQCTRCKKPVLASADKCPECGFVFASIAMFSKYINLAEEALRRNNLEEARQHLASAQSADPGEKTRTAELSRRIAADEALYEKPINELRQLIANKKFQAASEALARIISSFPKLNVSTQETQIKSALSKAQARLDEAKKKTASACADTCIEILGDCEDFKPAIEFLRATAPNACKDLLLKVDTELCGVTISWTRSSERGVSYRVVRKTGETAAKNETDGTAIADNITENHYKDERLTPGTRYSYSIFARRMGVYSPAVSGYILLLADVTDVRWEQKETNLYITWNTPVNNSGVKISRTHAGKEVILAENARGSFEDKNLGYNETYSYTLKVNYSGLPSSNGVQFKITPVEKIDQFQVTASQIKDDKYKISWDIKRKDIDIHIFVNENIIRKLKSDNNSCEIELPSGGFHAVKVSAYSGGSCLVSQNIQVNTYSSCEIDKAKSQITEKPVRSGDNSRYSIELSIIIAGTIPGNVTAFWYFIRTKSPVNKQAPWADANEIATAHDIYKISIDTYKKSNEILFTGAARDEDALYVTMFTVYNVKGKEIVSSPHKRRFDRPLTADILWKVSKPIIGNRRLSIEVKPNRPLTRLPKLILCASLQGQYLSDYTDANAEILMEIQEQEFDSPQTVFKKDYDVNSPVSSRLTKNSKLFLFDIKSVQNESYSLRWADGFTGKV